MIAHITTTLAQATYYGGYDAYYGNSGSMGGVYSGVTLIGLAILVISMLVGGAVQMGLKNAFARYSEEPAPLTGAEVARRMLRQYGLDDVQVTSTPGELTDHYNPLNRTVNLSDSVYNEATVAAMAVAAHECGHAVQHAMGYAPLRLRSALVPAVSFASNIVQWVLLAGVLFINTFPGLLWIGIMLFAVTTLFSVITLPVEINASSRAISWLSQTGITDSQTRPMAIDALKWAAYTYVVPALGSLATLFYYIGLARRD
jgi:Zn-dependent membrane protease YugP